MQYYKQKEKYGIFLLLFGFTTLELDGLIWVQGFISQSLLVLVKIGKYRYCNQVKKSDEVCL